MLVLKGESNSKFFRKLVTFTFNCFLTSSVNLLVRLTFKALMQNLDGKNYVVLNWIDRFGIEFRGYDSNNISSMINNTIMVALILFMRLF